MYLNLLAPNLPLQFVQVVMYHSRSQSWGQNIHVGQDMQVEGFEMIIGNHIKLKNIFNVVYFVINEILK